MGKIRLLDCTLRDGGYLNDWRFGESALCGITEAVAAAGVEIIELGFLDERVDFEWGRSIQPSVEGLTRAFARADMGECLRVAMIDYGTFPLEKIPAKKESALDGIRVIFKKEDREKAFTFAEELGARGYCTFMQAVSITSYDERELHSLCRLAAAVSPFALSIVDTYGLLTPRSLSRIYRVMDGELPPNVAIGFHAHNNSSLALGNALSFLDLGGTRDLVVDGTLFGMGKSAGNAQLELLAHFLNARGAHYAIEPMLAGIERYVLPYHARYGYSLPFFVAAATGAHPQYAATLAKKGWGMAEVYRALHGATGDLLRFDEARAEEFWQTREREVLF